MEYEKFDIERALAGEPVILRNGAKAYIRHLETGLAVKYPLIGFDADGYNRSWDDLGMYTRGAWPNSLDIVGMWAKEPLTMPDSFWELLSPKMVAIAKDGSGRWFCYSHEPTFRFEDEEWGGEDITKCHGLPAFNPKIFPDCYPKDSLIVRPVK